jgi:tetratricopeptide (TPR) repeat protein
MNKKTKEMVENELSQWLETQMGHLKPYAWNILLVVGLFVFAILGLAYYLQYRWDVYANQWRDLNVSVSYSMRDGNSARLIYVAEQYPDQLAGLWALQLAGDVETRIGLAMLPTDRKGGLDRINKAKANYQSILDSPGKKSPMLQQRSLFALAYAHESLGELDQANSLYNRLVDEAPDSAFAEAAKRGALRTGDQAYVALYDQFKTWEDAPAPGQLLPERPNIDFPDIDLSSASPITPGTDAANTSNPAEQAGEFSALRIAETPEVQIPVGAEDATPDTTGEINAGDESEKKQDNGGN